MKKMKLAMRAKNLPTNMAPRSRFTTSSRSLKCKPMSQGRSVFATARKMKLVKTLPSTAPITREKPTKGQIKFTAQRGKTVAIMNSATVMQMSSRTGTKGYIRARV